MSVFYKKYKTKIKYIIKISLRGIIYKKIFHPLYRLIYTPLSLLKYSNKYRKIISHQYSLREIKVISIEFCSICNLNCKYCFLEKGDRPTFLDIGIYKKLLSEICENREFEIKIMEWPISGCFFLHPKYQELIKITKEYKERYPNFTPWIILNDNMMLFDNTKSDFILKEGIVNQIICSIDGVDKETFEYMRPNANFEKVLENTNYLLRENDKNKNRIVIQINNGRDTRCLGRKLDSKLKEVFNQAALVTTWEPQDWNESFHKEHPRYKPYPFFCSFIFESISLSTSGAAIKCCMDLKEATNYGNFTKDTLKSIWFSARRQEFLRLMHEGKRRLIQGCNNCSISYAKQNKYLP